MKYTKEQEARKQKWDVISSMNPKRIPRVVRDKDSLNINRNLNKN